MRRIRYKIKSRLINAQACPIDCYDAQLHLIVVLLEKVVPQSPFITLSWTWADSKAKMLIIMNKHNNKDLSRFYSNSHHAVKVHELHQRYIHLRLLSCGMHVPVVEFMYLEFTRMQSERYCRRDMSLLLRLCDVFRALLNSLVCWFCTGALGPFVFDLLTFLSWNCEISYVH